jgi:tetratricopeptide (TPR) repeat protein
VASGSVTLSRPSPGEPRRPGPEAPPRWRIALLAPGALVLVTAVILGIFDAGFSETAWYPLALFLLALTVLVLVVAPPATEDRSRIFEVAVLLFGLFTLWSYASMLWADVPADAWSAANRTLLYWLAFALVGLRPWPCGAVRFALGLVAFGLALLAAGTLVATATASDPSDLFLGGRLAEPIGYANATANLWLIGFWPALHLAIARDIAWPIRGLALAAGTVLVEVALLSQSRGALLAFIVTAVAFVLLHPRHWGALAALAVSIVLVLVGWDTLTEVRNATQTGQLDDLMGDARAWIAVSAVIALVAGTAAALAERAAGARLAPSQRRRRLVDGSFYAVAAACLVGLVVVAFSSTGWLDSRWEDFKSGDYASVEGGDNRFGALGSGRYDFYRVSLNEWRDHPLAGVGAENFAVPYLQHRRTREAPRYAHSLAFTVVSTLGVVGALLLVGFLAAVGAAFARVRLRGSPASRGAAVGALAGAIAWLSHAMVDWLWEYPALTLLGVALLAIAARTSDRDPAPATGSGGWLVRTLAGRAVLGVLAVLAAVSLALPGAAARFERSAYKAQATDPETTIDRLGRAADLDPLDADALVGRSLLVRRAGRTDDARADLVEALDREPKNWFANFELGLLEAEQRRWGPAGRSVDRAAELNPGQDLIRDVRKQISARRTVDADDVERELSGQLSTRLQPFDSD